MILRAEAQKRYSFLYACTTLAGGFGGLLASAIGKMDGIRGYRGWRWVFILEGAFTCVVGAILYFVISDFPEEVKWLTAEEKEFVKARLYEDVGDSKRDEPLTVRSVLDVLKDCIHPLSDKIIVGGFMYFTILVPAYGYAYFAPTIIQGLGYGNIRTQLLSVPPWGCAFVLSMIVATASDYFKHRFTFLLILAPVSLTGFIILLVEHTRYETAICCIVLGSYELVLRNADRSLLAQYQFLASWIWKLCVPIMLALQFSRIDFSVVGGIIAVFAFLAKDAPKYIPGYSISIAFMCLSVLSNVVYFLGVTFENRARDRLQASGGSMLSEDEKKHMGDLNPDYRYLR
ncbi:putative transporter C11D3.18C [Grifola frondosa]|uniref:Putative transporter C11D3.18C n=1 Tax=Grifola frondosa TaxID=5627 RepID=A0A1C7LLT0_GRIFR|nr:putative transporter C11D3.18C [Grifola frondosa]